MVPAEVVPRPIGERVSSWLTPLVPTWPTSIWLDTTIRVYECTLDGLDNDLGGDIEITSATKTVLGCASDGPVRMDRHSWRRCAEKRSEDP